MEYGKCVTHHACDCIQAELKEARELLRECIVKECPCPLCQRIQALLGEG